MFKNLMTNHNLRSMNFDDKIYIAEHPSLILNPHFLVSN